MQIQRLTHLKTLAGRTCVITPSGKFMVVTALLLLSTTITSTTGQEFDAKVVGQNLSLDVYIYDTGKALVTGYADSVDGLIFLEPDRYTAQYTPKYSYENNTGQLYAWTDALTLKQGKTWKLMFSCWGFYSKCHIVFHLPGNLMLGRINSSKGLNYLILASSDSLTVDAQGYSMRDPMISVEYQQPLEEQSPSEIHNVRSGPNNLLPIAAFISILAIGSIFAFILTKRKKKILPCEKDISEVEFPDALKPIDAARPLRDATPSEASQFVDISEDEAEPEEMPLMGTQLESRKKDIQVSSEMLAVMDTLTPRERSILETLIKHGGRMTQTAMRYETGAPKSTLTMVLISLEKRNLVTRREWGRTNVIELSERLFFESEHS